LKVLVGYPDEETGTDYSSHDDIRNAFLRKRSETVVESSVDAQGIKTSYIDVVLWFTLDDGNPLVLEVKLDFARSIALLENQYKNIESTAIVAAIALLAALLGVLLVSISRTAIKPVQRITLAMQTVGKGNLDVRLDEGKKDEFGVLSLRFNEMVAGLKEKEGLYHYVSQSTVDAVRSSVRDDQGHVPVRRNLALFFSDIRGFTTFSESRDPEVVIGVLNKILSAQSRIIKAHSGDIDKFVGDEVMAIFAKTLDAAEAALEIQSELGRIREELMGLQIGIGIHEGTVLQGDVGSEEIRDFTVIGDTVNTAARLESVAGPGEILVSEDALRSLLKLGTWTGKPKGELKLKGKNIAIKTFALSGKKAKGAGDQPDLSPETAG
jgi:adenylate cyclase